MRAGFAIAIASAIAVASWGRWRGRPDDATTSGCVDVGRADGALTVASRSLETRSRLLWRRSHDADGALRNGLVLTATRLAFTAAERLHLLDRRGAPVKTVSNDGHEFLSSPIADPTSETFVVAGASSVIAVGRDGERRWTHALDASLVPGEMLVQTRPLLSPWGDVVLAGLDGHLRTIDVATGKLRSKRLVGVSTRRSGPLLEAGVGTDVFVSRGEGAGVERAYVVGLRGSQPPKTFGGGPHPPSSVIPTVGGVIGYGYVENQSRNGTVALTAFDGCGRVRWKGPEMRWLLPLAVTADGSVIVAERSPAAEDLRGALVMLGPKGNVLRRTEVDGPVAGAIVGADGLIQVIECLGGSNVRVASFSNVLERLEVVELEGQCPAGMALAEDGVLYLSRPSPSSPLGSLANVEIVAVQTRSPGPARTGWAMSRSDNAGRGWWLSQRE